jgi:hypothetical protein
VEVRFYVDPETGLPHIRRHDIDEDEVRDVLGRHSRTDRGEKAHGSPLAKPAQADTSA